GERKNATRRTRSPAGGRVAHRKALGMHTDHLGVSGHMLVERFARFALEEIEDAAFGVFAPARDADDGFAFRTVHPDRAVAGFAAADDVHLAPQGNALAEFEVHRTRHVLQAARNPIRFGAGEIERLAEGAPRGRHHRHFASGWVNLDDKPSRAAIELKRDLDFFSVDAQERAARHIAPLRVLARLARTHAYLAPHLVWRASFARQLFQ